MCYVACREIEINAVVVSPTSQHFLEIDERPQFLVLGLQAGNPSCIPLAGRLLLVALRSLDLGGSAIETSRG